MVTLVAKEKQLRELVLLQLGDQKKDLQKLVASYEKKFKDLEKKVKNNGVK